MCIYIYVRTIKLSIIIICKLYAWWLIEHTQKPYVHLCTNHHCIYKFNLSHTVLNKCSFLLFSNALGPFFQKCVKSSHESTEMPPFQTILSPPNDSLLFRFGLWSSTLVYLQIVLSTMVRAWYWPMQASYKIMLNGVLFYKARQTCT